MVKITQTQSRKKIGGVPSPVKVTPGRVLSKEEQARVRLVIGEIGAALSAFEKVLADEGVISAPTQGASVPQGDITETNLGSMVECTMRRIEEAKAAVPRVRGEAFTPKVFARMERTRLIIDDDP